MGTFTDTIKIAVDVAAGQTQGIKGFFSGLKADIGEAEGSFGKFKAAGSGAMDFVSNNAAGLAAGAGAAIAGFAISAIGDFQDVALKTGELSDALGISAEDASRWVEVAGDLGIGADKIETSMGKMLKTAGATPAVFDQYGVSIVRAKDGTVDANGTFLAVIDRLNGMTDPAERAAAAQKLLGKSWMDSAELIELGADGVKQRLDEVSGAKIMSDEQVGQARDFRDAMDNVGDAVDEIKLSLAEGLIPTLTAALGPVALMVQAFGKLHGAITTVTHIPIVGWVATTLMGPMALASRAVGVLSDAWDGLFGSDDPVILAGDNLDDLTHKMAEAGVQTANLAGQTFKSTNATRTATRAWVEAQTGVDAASDSVNRMRTIFGLTIPTTDEMAAAQKAVAAAAKEHDDRQKHLDDTIADVNAKVQEQIDRLNELHDASVSAADATIAVDDAQRKFAEAAAASNEVNKDAKSTADDKTAAVNAERDAMIDAAKASEAKAVADGEASGTTATGTQKIDAFNASLLNNAHFATPAAQEAIANYIAEANGIKPEIATQILAAIREGDIPRAQKLLDETSATRNAAIIAEAQTAQANRDLDAVAARPRTANIRANFTGAPQQALAIGGTIDDYAVAGEYGREVIQRNTAVVKPRAESANILGRAGGSGTVINVNVESGDPVKIAAALDRILWFRNAGPRKAA